MRNVPKHWTDRPVNDHLHAVIRGCCVLEERSASANSSASCQCMSATLFALIEKCQNKWTHGRILKWQYLAPRHLQAKDTQSKQAPPPAETTCLQHIIFLLLFFALFETNVFYQRKFFVFEPKANFCMFIRWMSYILSPMVYIVYVWFYVDSILQILNWM